MAGLPIDQALAQANTYGQQWSNYQALQAQQMAQHSIGDRIQKLELTSRQRQVFKRKGVMKLFRDYLEAHRDTIFTLILIVLADHFIFKGAFSETIKSAFSKLLDKAHQKIDTLETKP